MVLGCSTITTALPACRGAALKIGQMLSIQDENVLPPQFSKALERVRAGADIMPRRQLEQVCWCTDLVLKPFWKLLRLSSRQRGRDAVQDEWPEWPTHCCGDLTVSLSWSPCRC